MTELSLFDFNFADDASDEPEVTSSPEPFSAGADLDQLAVAGDDQERLFDAPAAWEQHWNGMPEFEQRNAKAASSINVYFKTDDDRRRFLEHVGMPPVRSRGFFWPYEGITRSAESSNVTIPQGKYPIFVISKGRWEKRPTSKALEKLGLDYKIIVEPQEYDAYASVIDEAKIVAMPVGNLGLGSIPARNFVWDLAIAQRSERHWILDDNIFSFSRLNNNKRTMVVDENPFVACEQMTDRYENVALSGLQYRFFADARDELAPFKLNTRIYSCILIRNDLPFRWRGRYNEDTDLSLRALKAGWCTILMYAYLIDKAGTMTMKGGNTDELYADDGRLKMAQSLVEQHPDCVTITEKWGRAQHHVDYTMFKHNELIPKEVADDERAA